MGEEKMLYVLVVDGIKCSFAMDYKEKTYEILVRHGAYRRR